MTVYQITPISNCKVCHGTGLVTEYHPYGSTVAAEYLTCDCVLEQLPEDFDDYTDEVDITAEYAGIIVNDGPEFEYDDLF